MTEPMRAVTGLLTTSRAQSHARAGDLDQAAQLLDRAGPPDSVGVLDLRARVHAQNGELAEADRCWARVQDIAPAHPGAAAGRRTIEQINTGRRRGRPLVHTGWLAAVAVAVVVTASVGGVAWLAGGWTDQRSRVESDQKQLHTQTERADAAGRRLASLDAERTTAEARRQHGIDAIAQRVARPGVLVERRAEDVRVVFSTGLFPQGASLSREGVALLVAVCHSLTGLDASTTVVGHAVAVPGGRTSGGSVVALARAQVAAQYLAAAAGLPLTAFPLLSADQADGPYPDAPRNRTVTLVLAPKPPATR
ncbi:MAG: hypothetical protein M3Z25_13740 [Actinomycetota bacterium]|nr:hypothetical protein [Actinomycetota bacterium]